MPGSPGTLPAPELAPGNRFALVVSTGTYADPSLRALRAPSRDATALEGLLADPGIGGFAVTSVTDGTAQELRLAVEEFLLARAPDDLLLVYLSCHGLVDLRRRLYFAATDTRKDRLGATGVEAEWLLDQLDDCRARRQVVVLDCCFSGAFARGAKGDSDLALGERFHGHGRGRVVLTASRGSEYSFEGEPVEDASMPGSVFTSALAEGIRTGAADLDRDGYISVDDAYAFAFDRVRASDAQQTPQRWLYGAEGSILIARSPAGVAPTELPAAVRSALEAPQPSIRLGGVRALGDWLGSSEAGRTLAARRALEEVAASDVPEVATAARGLLEEQLPSAAPGPAGAGTGPVAAGGGPGRRRLRHRARSGRALAVAAVAIASVAALVAVAAVAFTPWPGRESGGGDGSAVSGAVQGEVSFEDPWRLSVRNQAGLGDGCTVTLHNLDTGEEVTRTGIYDTRTYQVAWVGSSVRWERSDPRCELVPRPGSGDVALPFRQDCCLGDTEAFDAPEEVVVEVRDFTGNRECSLDLRDAGDGHIVDFGVVEAGGRPLRLVPAGSERVYLADPECAVRVSGP
jgi:hypothetical protein